MLADEPCKYQYFSPARSAPNRTHRRRRRS